MGPVGLLTQRPTILVLRLAQFRKVDRGRLTETRRQALHVNLPSNWQLCCPACQFAQILVCDPPVAVILAIWSAHCDKGANKWSAIPLYICSLDEGSLDATRVTIPLRTGNESDVATWPGIQCSFPQPIDCLRMAT
jgi:hypothetical protein